MEQPQPKLFETAMAMRAMLNLGYKNTDYALAEIIDNSIEANAKNIDILVVQALGGNTRSVWRNKMIAVLDDGSGIEPGNLTRVLSFGFGTHADASLTPGAMSFGKLGKFGVGLPNASISQAKDISVYSWQNGTESTYVSELFVEKILSGVEETQHPAELRQIPPNFQQMFQTLGIKLGEHGTLVVWDRVTDRCSWSKGSTLMDNVELTAGRIFRKFIYERGVKIRITVFKEGAYDSPAIPTRFIRVNDPMFLMKNSVADSYREDDKITVPADQSLFKPYPPESVSCFDLQVPYTNKDGAEDNALVQIRFSKCRTELRQRVNKVYAGATRVGQIAKQNQGVSILRAGRELELTMSWLPAPDTRNRWIGAEIDFPPALDEYFGVGSTKQTAAKLEALASGFNEDTILQEFNDQWAAAHPGDKEKITWDRMIELLRDDGDGRWVLYTVARRLTQIIRKIFNELRSDREETQAPESNAPAEPPKTSTDSSLGIKQPGKEVSTVIDETQKTPPEELTDEQRAELGQSAAGDPNAPNASDEDISEYERVIKFLEDNPQAKAVFANSKLSDNAFFNCEQEFDRIIIRFNTNHPAYEALFQQFGRVIDQAADPSENAEKRFENLDLLKVSFLLMMYAWAQTETSLTEDDLAVARSIRSQWGRNLQKLMNELKKQQES